MSHSHATVTFADGTEFHAEYNGTVDVARASFFETRDEVTAQWRSDDYRRCEDPENHEHEPVEYWTEYGGGFGWNTTACRACRVLTGPRSRESAAYEYGQVDRYGFPLYLIEEEE